MATSTRSKRQFTNDTTRPFYAVVGATDLAVEYARHAVVDVQARIEKVDLEPKVLREKARALVTSAVDELTDDAKQAQTVVESRMTELQGEAKTLPGKVEEFVSETMADVNEAYGDLAARGRDLVSRIRRQQSTTDAKSASRSVVTRAKTMRTQTTKSAKANVDTVKEATKQAADTTGTAVTQTADTAKRNVKSTTTSAKRAATATAKATTEATKKVGD